MPAHQRKFFLWILKNKKKFKIEFYQRPWGKFHPFPKQHDYICFLEFQGTRFFGLGSGTTQKDAMIKSCAEALERVLMKYHGLPNSNVIAVHTLLSQCKQNAKNELIERDAFLAHFYSKAPFSNSIKSSTSVFGRTLAHWQSYFKKFGYQLFVRKMSSPSNLQCVFVLARHPHKRHMAIGCAAERSITDALEKALSEAIRSINSMEITPGKYRPLSLNSFRKKKIFSVEDHLRISLHPSYQQKFFETFLSGQPRPQNRMSKKSKFTYRTYAVNKKVFNDLPLYFVKSENKEFQNLYFGKISPGHINIKSLKRFGITRVASVELDWPHPFP